MDILDKLLKDYGIFCNDEAYYKDLISTYSSDIKKIKEKILNDIKNAWNNYNNGWFVDFANKSSIDDIIYKIRKYKLELNPVIVQDLINKIPSLEDFLKNKLAKKDKWKDEEFEKAFLDNTILELVYNYAIINDRIDLGLDDINIKEVNYDALIGDSVKMYIKEIKALQDFEKNNERILKYIEYRKLVNATLDETLKKKYEKELLKYRNLIVESNLCLALPIANRYNNSDIDLLELIQEGSIGIISALERFDPSRHCAFSTYAIWWIRQAITRYIMTTSRTIRIPIPLYEEYRKVLRVREDLKNTLFRDPTEEEIAAKLGWPESKVIWTLKSFDVQVSLDAPVGNDAMEDSDALYSFVADDYDYEEELFKQEFTKKVMTGLKPREEFILRMRFGLDNGTDERFMHPHTLDEVGKELNLTRERVRQIEKKVINRFRNKEHITINHYINKKRCGFWEYFDGYSEAKVLEKLKYLSDDDLESLYKKYGKDLDKVNNLSTKDNAKSIAVINKIKKMLSNAYYKPKYRNDFTGRVGAKLVFQDAGKTLYEITNKTNEDVFSLLYSSSGSLELLKKVFGDDLLKPADDSNLTQGEVALLNTIIYNVKNGIVIAYNNCNLREILDCTLEEFEIVIVKQLPNNAAYNRFIIDLFGENYDKRVDFYSIDQIKFNKWLDILTNLRHRINKLKNIKEYKDYKTVEQILNKTTEEIEDIINRMDKNSKIYSIVIKYINKEDLSYSERTRFDNWCSSYKYREQKSKHLKDKLTYKILLCALNMTEEEYLKIYNNLSDNTLIKQALTRLKENDEVNSDDNTIIRIWISMQVYNGSLSTGLIKSLPNTKNKRNLINELKITEQELMLNISNTNYNSKRYQGILKYISNQKMDDSEKHGFYSWKYTIKRVYSEQIEVLTSKEHEKIKAPEGVELLKVITDKMPDELRKIMELRVGIYDGTLYTAQEIAEILSMDIEVVNELINEGIEFINKEKRGSSRKRTHNN